MAPRKTANKAAKLKTNLKKEAKSKDSPTKGPSSTWIASEADGNVDAKAEAQEDPTIEASATSTVTKCSRESLIIKRSVIAAEHVSFH